MVRKSSSPKCPLERTAEMQNSNAMNRVRCKFRNSVVLLAFTFCGHTFTYLEINLKWSAISLGRF